MRNIFFPHYLSGEPDKTEIFILNLQVQERLQICYKVEKGGVISLHRLLCGAGGIRTLVQTGKPYAFYTLIPAFGFRAAARPGPPTATLSPKTSS